MNFPDREQEQSPKGETPLPVVSANTLARCLGVTPKEVYDLAKAGSLSAARAGCTRSKIVYGVTGSHPPANGMTRRGGSPPTSPSCSRRPTAEFSRSVIVVTERQSGPWQRYSHRTPSDQRNEPRITGAVHWGVKIMRKPIFFVVRDAADWSVEAEWPDGTIERVKTFKAELAALDWLSWQSHAWLEWRGTDFGGAS